MIWIQINQLRLWSIRVIRQCNPLCLIPIKCWQPYYPTRCFSIQGGPFRPPRLLCLSQHYCFQNLAYPARPQFWRSHQHRNPSPGTKSSTRDQWMARCEEMETTLSSGYRCQRRDRCCHLVSRNWAMPWLYPQGLASRTQSMFCPCRRGTSSSQRKKAKWKCRESQWSCRTTSARYRPWRSDVSSKPYKRSYCRWQRTRDTARRARSIADSPYPRSCGSTGSDGPSCTHSCCTLSSDVCVQASLYCISHISAPRIRLASCWSCCGSAE